MKKEWLEFEKAVAAFIKALDPKANVQHDIKTPDKDTNAPRQRDVWIEGFIAKFIPIKVLISCKRYKRKLNEQDIDHFKGEFESSNANKGVIYSYSGFNKLALEKAMKNGFSCMKLFTNEPPEIPEMLVFNQFFCCKPHIYIELISKNDPENCLIKWNDILQMTITLNNESLQLIDHISQIVNENENQVFKNLRQTLLPKSWSKQLTISEPEIGLKVVLNISELWENYVAKIDAYLINGTYAFENDKFIGSVITPIINLKSSEPGPGWEKIDDKPNSVKNSISIIQRSADIKETILNTFGDMKLIKLS